MRGKKKGFDHYRRFREKKNDKVGVGSLAKLRGRMPVWASFGVARADIFQSQANYTKISVKVAKRKCSKYYIAKFTLCGSYHSFMLLFSFPILPVSLLSAYSILFLCFSDT